MIHEWESGKRFSKRFQNKRHFEADGKEFTRRTKRRIKSSETTKANKIKS